MKPNKVRRYPIIKFHHNIWLGVRTRNKKLSFCQVWWYTPLIPALKSKWSSVILRSAWCTQTVPVQPGLHSETMSNKTKRKRKLYLIDLHNLCAQIIYLKTHSAGEMAEWVKYLPGKCSVLTLDLHHPHKN